MPSELQIHFLDVGPEKYGDSILICYQNKTILIDGGHPRDLRGSAGYPSIPAQLQAILGRKPPHELSMLVVTHAHNDHIGCLPELVSKDIITAKKAYVADVGLGWGQESPDALEEVTDEATSRILAILREGAGSTLRASDPEQAIADAMKLKDRYVQMLDSLRDQGTEVIVCTGEEDRAALEAEFSEIGLSILGPTQKHLQVCADQITSIGRDAIAIVEDSRARDASISDATLVQKVLEEQERMASSFLSDMWGTGSALNNQSIVLSLSFAGKRILLAGDMQFAKSEVEGLDDEMTVLRQVVAKHGPFDIIKTTHHTSYNGLDQSVLDEQVPKNSAFYLVHTGGINDSHHPGASCLSLIRERRRKLKDVTWLRVDRNGKVSFTISEAGRISFETGKGRPNIFTANEDALPEAPSAERPLEVSPSTRKLVEDGGYVEVVTRVPHTRTKVTVTIDVEPPAGSPQPNSNRVKAVPSGPADAPVQFQLPSDRKLPKLLFVTDERALGRKIGSANAKRALHAISDGGHVIANERFSEMDATAAAAQIRSKLRNVEGVVLVGSQDIVPSLRLDTLGPDLRAKLPNANSEPDGFLVWNDDIYGDTDDDRIAELPVSRLADGGSAEALSSAMGARGNGNVSRFGIRNSARPFADTVFGALPGNAAMFSSQPFRSNNLRPHDVKADFVYFMLHGDDSDTTRFWGEADGTVLEAFTHSQVPQRFSGVVFSGCCWGALTTTRRALHFSKTENVTCRTANDSIALRFLASGARAFIGCTGVHYSPPGKEPTKNGGPMHTYCFSHMLADQPPSRALALAKKDFFNELSESASPGSLAISLKIVYQFTCLGLGW